MLCFLLVWEILLEMSLQFKLYFIRQNGFSKEKFDIHCDWLATVDLESIIYHYFYISWSFLQFINRKNMSYFTSHTAQFEFSVGSNLNLLSGRRLWPHLSLNIFWTIQLVNFSNIFLCFSVPICICIYIYI